METGISSGFQAPATAPGCWQVCPFLPMRTRFCSWEISVFRRGPAACRTTTIFWIRSARSSPLQDLSSYRLIAVANSDRTLLRDEVIANVRACLVEDPARSACISEAHCPPRRLDKKPIPSDLSWELEPDLAMGGAMYRWSRLTTRSKGNKAAVLSGASEESRNSYSGRATSGRSRTASCLIAAIFPGQWNCRDQLNRLVALRNKRALKLDGPIGMRGRQRGRWIDSDDFVPCGSRNCYAQWDRFAHGAGEPRSGQEQIRRPGGQVIQGPERGDF